MLVCSASNDVQVVAISGSGQQHGSVYWAKGAQTGLSTMSSSKSLKEIVPSLLSRDTSPIWMDSSTTKQCLELEAAVGGAENMASLTGSHGYERFTANQILKIVQEQPEVYSNTEHISLISSYMYVW